MRISLIAAVSENGVIGVKGDLPWNLPDDMRFFSRTTRGHHVLMGRINYDSIPNKYRPLPDRVNIIITRNTAFKDDRVQVFHSIEEGIAYAQEQGEDELFIIGGGKIYEQTIGLADRLYITHVHAFVEGDTRFPDFDTEAWLVTDIAQHSKDAVHNFSFNIRIYDRKV